MDGFVTLSEILTKLAVAVILGGIIGWERETHDRPAGLRTHVLVCVGSAVYMILSMSFTANADPSRIASQVATGMGFLGAGTIIRHRSGVRGLTTAASLWAVAAIGLCVGRGGQGYMIAVSTTAFVFVALRGLSWVEKRMVTKKRQYRQATLRVRSAKEVMPHLQSLVSEHDALMKSLDIGESAENGTQQIRLALRLSSDTTANRLTLAMTSLEGILSIEWD
ncbi:MAG: hypothetical protein GTN69_06570 [Armatimonadetes bacterium]|nr:hypothetical protein [Armatimonadota bacterium]NIO75535.1 hypothetical protein [Armatimonadota bacterium]NIO95912.1 hypothetical protein [Armatimonadota bacterium]